MQYFGTLKLPIIYYEILTLFYAYSICNLFSKSSYYIKQYLMCNTDINFNAPKCYKPSLTLIDFHFWLFSMAPSP